MSQETLADALGIATQQISKYEISTNRVAASRLWHIGKALDVRVGYFFEGVQKRGGRARKPLKAKAARGKGRSARR